ncbi:MAG: PhnD/SsuA/transferrin family substrate-binding protein [Rhodospirillaceae bacterium]|nr:PhnD/SsuA/transferrin family substrate-binding protein [Rhodospirillaceae bacterium]
MALASLPMYDLEEVAKATDAWWAGLARAFRREGVRDVPVRLTRRGTPEEHWAAPDLLFTQCCGYPLTHAFAGTLQVVATPCYDAPGCCGPIYCSFVVVREDLRARDVEDLRGCIAAVNSADSQSGYSALRALVTPFHRRGRFFAAVRETGSHLGSLALVLSGGADVAAIDCVTHGLLMRHRPEALDGTRVLCRTPSAPALPYVTAASAGEDTLRRLRTGLFQAFADPSLAGARDALLLSDAEVLPATAYGRIRQMEEEAVMHGYPRLA